MKNKLCFLGAVLFICLPAPLLAQWSRNSADPAQKVINPATLSFIDSTLVGYRSQEQSGGYDNRSRFLGATEYSQKGTSFFGRVPVLSGELQVGLGQGTRQVQKINDRARNGKIYEYTLADKEILYGRTLGEAAWGVSIKESTQNLKLTNEGKENRYLQEIKFGRVSLPDPGYIWGASLNWAQYFQTNRVDIDWFEWQISSGYLAEGGTLVDFSYLRGPLRRKPSSGSLVSQVHEQQTQISWAIEIPYGPFALHYHTNNTTISGYEGTSDQKISSTGFGLNYHYNSLFFVSLEQISDTKDWADTKDLNKGQILTLGTFFGGGSGSGVAEGL